MTNKTETIAQTPLFQHVVSLVEGYILESLSLIGHTPEVVQFTQGDADWADCLVVSRTTGERLVKIVPMFAGAAAAESYCGFAPGSLRGFEVYTWVHEQYWFYARYVTVPDAPMLPQYVLNQLIKDKLQAIVDRNPLPFQPE